MIEVARELAQRLVAPLGRRWSHVQAVAVRAEELRAAVHVRTDPAEWNDAAETLLVASAWLHDVGYASALVKSGLHAADGANYLRGQGVPARVVNLVAHHSGARYEAAERGMPDILADYPFEDDLLSDALATADLTTGPDGERFSYDERIDEVFVRYPADHPVHQFWRKARPVVGEAISRTEARLLAQPR
ncbi:HD domain-containing protein [Lentzea tibetensis]|uniref:HD domain-containing protein n=1 Tax=Lentzea tibetensis TaxID=2591470 RepID=A0A563EUH8_9PSEU|nr:HD domain-containing protein [Lentzea tibetensis]